MASLQGKVIAITGGASGIGLATARICAERGASLAISDIQADVLENAAAELRKEFPSTEVVATKVDVTDSKSVDSWIKGTKEHFGKLDGAANIAGVEAAKKGVFCDVDSLGNDEWDFVIKINLTGVFYCVRSQLQVMERGASIVNCASLAGLMGRPGICAYSVSKHGVVGLTRTVAKEVGGKGIRVNAVAPGPVETPMLQRLLDDAGTADRPVTNTYANIPLKRLAKPEELAKTFVFLLSDDSSWTTGATYSVDGGVVC